MGEKRTRKTKTPVTEPVNALLKLFPTSGQVLLKGGGKQFVEQIGVEAVRQAIYNVLLGENLRTQTEPLTRRRIAQVSGAVIAMLTNGYLSIENFEQQLSALALEQLRNGKRFGNAAIWPARWVIGLTGKGNQNVLRSNQDAASDYIDEFEKVITEAAAHCKEQFGDYSMTLSLTEKGETSTATLDWRGIARLTTAIGAQKLTIRGSDKAIYGKLFEKLILGSILTILGFQRVDPITNQRDRGVFWLSDSSDNRESDATVILAPGKIARFDIGFIGSGNSEISKDKLSRFAREVETQTGKLVSTTFIIVDRLPRTSKTERAAELIGAEIVQMSMQYWPKTLCSLLHKRFGFSHELQNMSEEEIGDYFKEKMKSIPVQDFLNTVSLEEAEQDGVVSEGEEDYE